MMPSFASPSARTALVYITFGVLIVIWTGVWYIYLVNNRPDTNSPYYWCSGLLLTGIAFVALGFALGRIGQSARQAEIPPEAVITTPLAVDADNNVATTPAAPTAQAMPANANVNVPLTKPVKVSKPITSANPTAPIR
jgi:hypothetical protein